MKNTCEYDLACVDFSLAEMYIEKGINPLPSACDGFDFTIFEQPVKVVAQKFITAKNNMIEVLKLLSNEKTETNAEELATTLGNMQRKIAILDLNQKDYHKKDFSFIELYNKLKVVQNELGMSVPSFCLNVLGFIDEDMDIIAKKDEILKYIQEVKKFNGQARDLYEPKININTKSQTLVQQKARVLTKAPSNNQEFSKKGKGFGE